MGVGMLGLGRFVVHCPLKSFLNLEHMPPSSQSQLSRRRSSQNCFFPVTCLQALRWSNLFAINAAVYPIVTTLFILFVRLFGMFQLAITKHFKAIICSSWPLESGSFRPNVALHQTLYYFEECQISSCFQDFISRCCSERSEVKIPAGSGTHSAGRLRVQISLPQALRRKREVLKSAICGLRPKDEC